jgi:hypothetical protein
MGSNMNDESILKRTLILTGKLVGIFSIWVALLSVVVTVAASRAVGAPGGASVDKDAPPAAAETPKKDDGARIKNSPAHASGKPNG